MCTLSVFPIFLGNLFDLQTWSKFLAESGYCLLALSARIHVKTERST